MFTHTHIHTQAFAMHWSACIFLSLDRDHCPAEFSWIHAAGLQDAEAVDVYVASLYWAVATFLTIGYGDVSGRCVCLCMCG